MDGDQLEVTGGYYENVFYEAGDPRTAPTPCAASRRDPAIVGSGTGQLLRCGGVWRRGDG